MSRMTENDKSWGPFTWGPWHKTISAIWTSGGGEDEENRNSLRITAFGKAVRVWLPNIIRPWRIKHMAHTWDEETIKRLGRNYYYESWPREYGFSLSDMGNGFDFLQVFFGAQTHDSRTTMDWCTHLPWKQWDCVRHSLYEPDGSHYYTEPHWKIRRKLPDKAQFEFYEKKESCPASYFGFEDYDGEMIVAICHITEMEWHKGVRWFSWLKYFSKPKISRTLDLEFTKEVGPEKGSWKGGTTGHGIEMLTGESPEQAFMRYCDTERDARHGRKFKIRFIGKCNAPPSREIRVAINRGWVETPSGSGRWIHQDIIQVVSTEEMLRSIREENKSNNACALVASVN